MRPPIIRLSGWLIAALGLLAATGYLGISNSLPQFAQATTLGQRLETVAELAYGILGFVAAGALLTARPWTGIVIAGWGVAAIAAAGLAAVYWGAAGWGAGLAAALASALVVLFVFWLAKRALARQAR